MQNELIHETSPYLLQHAHNPVHWQIWGDKAFAAARAQNKPILVSIGYATCHWCHVMERESFEDQRTADFMNQHFVCIKLDREERPDIDSVMMEVVQMISGNGGWPLNCFLLPDGRPFFAGTYFPPEPRYGRTSWLQLLDNIQKAYSQRPEEVSSQAEQIHQYLQKSEQAFSRPKQQNLAFSPATDPASHLASLDFFQTAFYQLRDSFDRYYGGFGNAPKFPASFALRFCMNYSHFFQQPEGRDQAHFSLYKMAQAGIYDQIGGGFARYATDQGWNIPHFEKMLYDNALLLRAYAQAYAQIGENNEYSRRFAEVCEQTFGFLQREMRAEMGLYYSAIDADSEGQEGKFYTWELAELRQLLTTQELDLLQKLMDLQPNGNWEHRNILYFNLSLADYCRQSGLDLLAGQELLNSAFQKLLQARQGRIRPITDDKIMLDWNALLVSAFCDLYRTFQKNEYYQAAKTAIDALLGLFVREAGQLPLFHTYKNGQGKNAAFLDDYSFLVAACLDFYQISFDSQYLQKAQDYTELIINQFADEQDGLFYFTEQGADILIRRKDLYDNATPSANSVMGRNLLTLALLLDRADYQQKAEKMLQTMSETAQRFPQSFANWLNAGLILSQSWKEIVVIGADYQRVVAEIWRLHIPNAIIVGAAQADESLALLSDKIGFEGQTLIYLCQQYSCQKPVATVAELLKLL